VTSSCSGGPTLPARRRALGRGTRLGTTALLTAAAVLGVVLVGSPSASGPAGAPSLATAGHAGTSGLPAPVVASVDVLPVGDPARPPAGEATGTTARSPERTASERRTASPDARGSRSGRDPLLADLVAAGLVPGVARWTDDPASSLPQRGQPRPAPPALVTPEGFHVVAGTAAAGDGEAETVRYTVELDPTLRADPDAVAATVEAALHDERSWARDRRLERIEDPDQADVRVLLAHPDEVDALCGAAGLDTEGRYSCWTGEFAALNAWRWEVGAHDFDDLDTYRRYLINHEFGHGLGYGHVACPAPGELAPVMMQQSITTDGCVANGWPYPDAGADADS
jgi:hypothetical protein